MIEPGEDGFQDGGEDAGQQDGADVRQQPDRAEIEREAREYGWAPREKWRGGDDTFVDAGEFVKRARQHLPLVNKALQKEREERRREAAAYEQKQREFEKRLAALDKTYERMTEVQIRQALDAAEAEKRRALTLDDPRERARAYEEADHRERQVMTNLSKAVERPAPERERQGAEPLPRHVEQAFGSWAAQNTWVNDPALLNEAKTIRVDIDAITDPEGHFAAITEEMARRHPERVGGRKPAAAQQTPRRAVESGGEGMAAGGGRQAARGWNSLPAEARAACDRMNTNGRLRGKPDEIRKQYAATYWSEYGE